jgi:hypothetical protein
MDKPLKLEVYEVNYALNIRFPYETLYGNTVEDILEQLYYNRFSWRNIYREDEKRIIEGKRTEVKRWTTWFLMVPNWGEPND